MPIKLAILGLDPIQRDWLQAIDTLENAGVIKTVAAGHRTQAAARDVADLLHVPAFDDMRQLLRDAAPQALLIDRHDNVSADFLVACFEQGIGVLSVGPPVKNVGEACKLAEALDAQTNLLMVAPALVQTPGFEHGTHPDVVVRPIRFVSAEFSGLNHASAKSANIDGSQQPIVRSLSVLAWDAIASLIDLLDMPEAVFASIRGTTAAGDTFTDIAGAAGLVLRFGDSEAGSVVATVALSDRTPNRRAMLLVTPSGSARVEDYACESRDADGKLLDSTRYPLPGPAEAAAVALREFLAQFTAPTSPHRGWTHRVDKIAASMEALIVSHRTGQPESPAKFLSLRR